MDIWAYRVEANVAVALQMLARDIEDQVQKNMLYLARSIGVVMGLRSGQLKGSGVIVEGGVQHEVRGRVEFYQSYRKAPY
jgi:hypothetical protein